MVKTSKEAEHRLVVDEDREIGVVSTATYMEYIRSGGVGTFSFVAFLMCVGQAAMMTADVWLKIWSEAEDQTETYYMLVYVGLGTGTVFIGTMRALFFFTAALRGSSKMHDTAFRAIVQAPMGFFSGNPLGRIVNKFASDQGQVDEMLPATVFDCVQIGSICVGSVVMVVIALPWMLLAMLPLAYVFLRVRSFYVSWGREFKRLEGMGKSPVFALFHATLHGLVTIRAFGRESATQDAFLEKLEGYGEAWYWWLMANRWVGFQLDMISTTLLSLTVLLGVVLRDRVDAGLIGLAIMYSIQLSGTFQYCIRQSAQVENQMTSCERVMYYGRSIAPEESIEDLRSKQAAPEGWLSSSSCNAAVQFKGVEMRYRDDLPLVLKDVSWSAGSGSKIGIVGRTGSGKSSTIMALTRLYQHGPAGMITIDGVDITSLPIAILRENVALIQQEPHLFVGTVRFNLDPWGRHSDEEIEEVLAAVQLKDAALGGDGFNSSGHGLAAEVSESGANLSVGQRQLLSLARAMLKNSSLILMDEATANVDFETDSLIQTLMRENEMFKKATLVVVAHRISTIIDSDIVLVMGDGRVVESGPPAELLAIPDGAFATMAAVAGNHGGVATKVAH
jgi:ABC-type multidrug transport system fused ATPase/permease subunit